MQNTHVRFRSDVMTPVLNYGMLVWDKIMSGARKGTKTPNWCDLPSNVISYNLGINIRHLQYLWLFGCPNVARWIKKPFFILSRYQLHIWVVSPQRSQETSVPNYSVWWNRQMVGFALPKAWYTPSEIFIWICDESYHCFVPRVVNASE